MKTASRILIFSILALGLSSPSFAARLVLQPGSSLWLKGDSTLHIWHSSATVLNAEIELGADRANAASFYDGVKGGQVGKFKLHVPVDGLKSGKSQMDSNMYKALRQKEYPEIVFEIRDYKIGPVENGKAKIQARGSLTVSGKTKEIDLDAQAVPGADGQARVQGSYDLLMTDYGVQPPVFMMGALKTADKVSVHYDLDLKFVP
jgi:polyisoprenoid-binding protein YceI